jgi:integrase
LGQVMLPSGSAQNPQIGVQDLACLPPRWDSYQDQGLIFASSVGTPTNSKNLYWRSFKSILKRAGLPDIKFHELRHTCATIRFMRGQHPKKVQELLGHASIVQTIDTYSHVIPGMGDDDVMEDALS